MKPQCGEIREKTGKDCLLQSICHDWQRFPCPPQHCSKCGAAFNPVDGEWRSTAESWEHRCKRRGRR